jgi:hypothetical protein
MKTYKGIPLSSCPHGREMSDAELKKAELDGFKMLIADGWKKDPISGDEWKEPSE